MPNGDRPHRDAHVKRIKSKDGSASVDLLRIDKLPIAMEATKDGIKGQIINYKERWNDDPDKPGKDADRKYDDLNVSQEQGEIFHPVPPNGGSPPPIPSVDLQAIKSTRFDFKGAKDGVKGQLTRFTFDNDPSHHTGRKVTTVRVINNDLGGFDPGDKVVKWADYETYLNNGQTDESQYLDVEMVDQFKIRWAGTKDGIKGQITDFVLTGNEEVEDLFNPPPADTTLIPVRLDPFQTIVNVNWGGLFIIFEFTWTDVFNQGLVVGGMVYNPDDRTTIGFYQCGPAGSGPGGIGGDVTYLPEAGPGPNQIVIAGDGGLMVDADPSNTAAVCAGNPDTSGGYAGIPPPYNLVVATISPGVDTAKTTVEFEPSSGQAQPDFEDLTKADLLTPQYLGTYYGADGSLVEAVGPEILYYGYTKNFVFRAPIASSPSPVRQFKFKISKTMGQTQFNPQTDSDEQNWMPVTWTAYIFPTANHQIDSHTAGLPIDFNDPAPGSPHSIQGSSPELVWQVSGTGTPVQSDGEITLTIDVAGNPWTLDPSPPAPYPVNTPMAWGESIHGVAGTPPRYQVAAFTAYRSGMSLEDFSAFADYFYPDTSPWDNLEFGTDPPPPLPGI